MRYIVAFPAVAMVAMTIIMLILIRILSNAAVEYDIKQELSKSMSQNFQYITIQDRKLEIQERFSYKSDNVFFLLVNRDGEVVAGQYPESDFPYVSVRSNHSQSVDFEGEKYYVRDVWIGRTEHDVLLLRGIIKRADAYSRYRTIEIVSYLSIISVFCGILLCELIFAKKISGELKDMCRTAENMKQQEQFTSDVAHELRTPIAVVMAQCQYAKGQIETKEEIEESLDVIYRQSKKVSTIITQLLDFSRLDQGTMKIQEENLDLVEIVQSICEEQQEKAGDRVTILAKLEEICITGDINLISIAVQNLIANAIKFSYENGVIEVETGKRENQVFVSVRDHGIGIEQEDLEHIFRRFYKCDKSRNIEGFGLGLSLSMKIAQKHGGTITVSSKVGEGSIFTLLLPL